MRRVFRYRWESICLHINGSQRKDRITTMNQWQWSPGVPAISSPFGLAWKFNLKNQETGEEGEALPPHTRKIIISLLAFCTQSIFHSWEQTLPRAAWGWGFHVSFLTSCPGEPSHCKMAREAIFNISMSGFVWELWYYWPQVSDGEIWLWRFIGQ